MRRMRLGLSAPVAASLLLLPSSAAAAVLLHLPLRGADVLLLDAVLPGVVDVLLLLHTASDVLLLLHADYRPSRRPAPPVGRRCRLLLLPIVDRRGLTWSTGAAAARPCEQRRRGRRREVERRGQASRGDSMLHGVGGGAERRRGRACRGGSMP